MNLEQFLSKASKWAGDNSPSILTGIAVTGTLTTAFLAGKASFKASEVIRDAERRRSLSLTNEPDSHTLDNREKTKLVWTLYIPTATSAGLTIAAIIGVNKIGLNRTAAMAAAFQTSQSMFSDYKAKVVERVGEHKERQIHDEVAQDRLNRNPVGNNEVFITGGGDVLCYDDYSARYFRSSMEEIKTAMNNVNYKAINHGDVALSEFYNKIGLPSPGFSEEVGWTGMSLMEIVFSTGMSDDKQPCIVLNYNLEPIRNYGGR